MKSNGKEQVEISQTILKKIPPEAEVTRIEYEGPALAVYTKKPEILVEQSYIIAEIVKLIRKRIVVRSDPSIRAKERETEKVIKKIVSEEGFTVLLVKAIDEVIKKKLGVEGYPRYTTIMACGADLAKMALDVSKDVGTLFPCSFVVYEEDNKVIVAHVSIMKMSTELGIVSQDKMAHVIEETSKRVQKAWGKL